MMAAAAACCFAGAVGKCVCVCEKARRERECRESLGDRVDGDALDVCSRLQSSAVEVRAESGSRLWLLSGAAEHRRAA